MSVLHSVAIQLLSVVPQVLDLHTAWRIGPVVNAITKPRCNACCRAGDCNVPDAVFLRPTAFHS